VYTARATTLQQQISAAKANIAAASSPTALYAEKLALVTLEQQLAELQINNQSPQKTFRTTLAEEIAPAQPVAQTSLWRQLALNGLVGLAVGLLGSWLLEWSQLNADLRRTPTAADTILPTQN
jgi:hypothetical protein